MDDLSPFQIMEKLNEWYKLRNLLLGDHLGFALASGQDLESQLNSAAHFATILEDIVGEIRADIDTIDERIARFLRELEEYDNQHGPANHQ